MKKIPYSLFVLVFCLVGCNLFSNSRNDTTSTTSSSPAAPANNSATVANTSAQTNSVKSPTSDREFTKDDYVGRWMKTLSGADHIIEFREDGTGTISLDDRSPYEARQNFTWKYEAKHAVFTIKKPVVNEKIIDSGTFTVHAKLIEDGKKMQTDFSAFTRAKGDDVFEQQ